MSSTADPDQLANETLSADSDSDNDISASYEGHSDQDEGNIEEKKSKLEELKAEVVKNPYQYQSHSEIITLYRELGLYNELEQARFAMKAVFPLDQTLWLDWLNDEIQLASSLEEHKKTIALFDVAVEDYLAIPIWESYLDFLVERFTDGLGLDIVRHRMQKAILATQYHYDGGHAIWTKVFQFEESMLEFAPSDAQTKLMLELYSARLLIPHNELEDTFSRFSSFVSAHLPQEEYEATMKAANANYSESLRISLELGPYEDYLKTYAFTWEAYHAYIEFLKSQPAPTKNKGVWLQFAKALYERAAAHHPTNPAVWISYQTFLVSHFPMADILGRVALRGMRNCPWSGALVVFYLRSLEASGIDKVQVAVDEAIASKMLHSSVEELALVLLESCSIAQRLLSHTEPDQLKRLREILRNSVDQLYSVFPAGDAHYRVLKYWAHLEAFQIKDVEAARKVWGEITRHHKNRAVVWLQSSQFEAQYGTLNRSKGLLIQASRTMTDDPNSILVAWEDFERLHGDLKSNQQATADIHAAQMRQMNRETQSAMKHAELQAQEEAKKERARTKDRANKARKRGSKRKRPSKDSAPDQKEEGDSEDDEKKPPKIKRSDQLGTTLFVCNFAPEVDCTRLRSLFEKFGQVKEVRKPNPTVGTTRNFAYVEFSTPEEAKNALELNGHVLEREMILSVKLSDPSQRKPRSTGPNAAPSAKRLFVSNLPASMAQNSNLLALFSPYGAIDFARAFTDKSGVPNGRAIIEFSQEESGYAALALNSTLLEERVITVCIADPAARKNRSADHRSEAAASEPLPPSAQTSSAPPKSELSTQASFKPRQVAHVKHPHNRLDVKSALPTPSGQTKQPARSNQDFRDLLFGKKN
ncbi:Squamous cell carcinoma antigen recognized by T-cells 3 [Entomophthora muscae]|nr:Squamous cell carcinoma antigen recognized by T-cells 3 [Entomophthora muscae]